MDDQEQKYRAGFNHGYTLAAYEPELATAIFNAVDSNKGDYASGLSSGVGIYQLDHAIPIKEEMSKHVTLLDSINTPERQFTKGFNHGYAIAKDEPELAKLITKSGNNKSDYFKGLVLGKQEYNMEKIRERPKNGAKSNMPPKNINKSKDRSR